MKWLFDFVVFPGFVFTAVIGCIVKWFDRKLTARIQWRVGPPFLQQFYDFIKLTAKETIIPKGAGATFVLPPIISVIAVTIVSTLIWKAILNPEQTFVGDLIVVIYFLMVPNICAIIGGAASRNPLASLGVSRELKLLLADELPFILAAFVPVIKAHTIRLGDLLQWQWNNELFIASASGIIAFLVILACMQAKLAYQPFDIPEAETEIIAGPYTEYSGVLLGLFLLSRWMLLFALPIFVVVMFLGGIKFSGWHTLWGILKYVGLLILIIVVKNTNPRIRIDQALKFFWWGVTPLAILAVVLALFGL